ncbi:Ger(x)C family spore germination protein [Paenibacillus allorhizosphaerae]|uniref:Ger(X)C family spore germination protein n=1 Tax=Paenibacillus allorhizosphaerae TaxID=2849866 RepID=A0ABM8VDH2_9BACL|nr:Ger(x)C family spore germination protein [Paenibacillus allorhizosphaerae]CAG7627748.1 hypothetical protein PAECIP111802_01385 [Paenibacillus allorhizosphaerae]
MFRLWKSAVALLLVPLLMTGCWDIKHVQDINYVAAIGIDYADGKYHVYVQMLDFSSVAKMETGKPTAPVPVWIGKGSGDNPLHALDDLYQTSQLRIFYGQVNAVVVSESLIKKGIDDFEEMLRRHFELRYTPWVFGSSMPIDQLFAVTAFFNLSPLITLLHQPRESYKQNSVIAPISMREFYASYREPGKTTQLPSLTITDQYWKRDKKAQDVLQISGIYVLQNKKFKGWIEKNRIPGLRWVDPRTRRAPLIIQAEGKAQVGIALESPKVEITFHTTNDLVTYGIEVMFEGQILYNTKSYPEAMIEQEAAERVRMEIVQTYQEGLKDKADLLQLEHALYRKKNREWKKLHERNGITLKPDSLKDVRVTVKLNNSGKIKN